jgi:hypothetical protein
MRQKTEECVVTRFLKHVSRSRNDDVTELLHQIIHIDKRILL